MPVAGVSYDQKMPICVSSGVRVVLLQGADRLDLVEGGGILGAVQGRRGRGHGTQTPVW